MRDEVGSLTRAAALLAALAEADVPLGASAAAQRANVARNTAFRTLRTLRRLGWVSALGEPPRYRPSAGMAHLFGGPWQRCSLTAAAHPPLKRLSAALGETVYLSVRDDDRAVNVQVIEGRGLLRVAGALGQGFPLHACAPGKIFLAFEPGLLDRVVRQRLPALTPSTITGAAALRTEIRRVRKQGWALNREELARGLVGIAVPILDAEARCVGALGVLAPYAAMPPALDTGPCLPTLRTTAGEIERALGRGVEFGPESVAGRLR